jgi:hypothetical protein
MPGLIHALSETILGIRAFRRFFRSTSRVTPPGDPGAVRVHP